MVEEARTGGLAHARVARARADAQQVTVYHAIRPQVVEPLALTGEGVDGSAPYFQDVP